MRLSEQEFKAIKKAKNVDVKTLAGTMQRSQALIIKVRASKDYQAYKELIKSEHLTRGKRVPLKKQISDAKIEELLTVRSRGRFGAYKYACNRLKEFGL